MREVDDKEEKEKSSILDKIKSIKHIDIVIAVLVIVVVLAIYFGMSYKGKTEPTITSSTDADFVREIERALSRIEGASKVSVVINYSDDTPKDIATRVESVTKVDKDGAVSIIEEKREPIIIKNGKDNAPIILSEKSKKIKGVVVVAKGADNVRVKLSIIDAMMTLLDINSDQIRVYNAS